MPFLDGLKMIAKIREKEFENKAWEMWLSLYPDMVLPRKKVQKNKRVYHEPLIDFMSFDDFLRRTKQPEVVSKRPVADILQEAEQIQNKINRRRRGE